MNMLTFKSLCCSIKTGWFERKRKGIFLSIWLEWLKICWWKVGGSRYFLSASQKVFSPIWEKKYLIDFVECCFSRYIYVFTASLKQQLRSPSHTSSFLFFSLFPLHSQVFLSLESLPIQILHILFLGCVNGHRTVPVKHTFFWDNFCLCCQFRSHF